MLDSFASFDIAMLGSVEHHPRRQLWRNIFTKIHDEKLIVKSSSEYDKLVLLKSGMKWIDMLDREWRDIYGALFDESDSFNVSENEIMKIEKDVHRTFGLFSRNVPILRYVLVIKIIIIIVVIIIIIIVVIIIIIILIVIIIIIIAIIIIAIIINHTAYFIINIVIKTF